MYGGIMEEDKETIMIHMFAYPASNLSGAVIYKHRLPEIASNILKTLCIVPDNSYVPADIKTHSIEFTTHFHIEQSQFKTVESNLKMFYNIYYVQFNQQTHYNAVHTPKGML